MNTHTTQVPEQTQQVNQTNGWLSDWFECIDSYALKRESELHFEISTAGVSLRPLLNTAHEDAKRVWEKVGNMIFV